jgi:hypothetical protein
MGKSTISMVIFNSYVKLPEGKTAPFFVSLENHATLPTSPSLIKTRAPSEPSPSADVAPEQ